MIGERIKTLRKEKDLLQKELAQKLELSQQTISLYESSRREPDYETLDKIARFFDVTSDYLLGRSSIRNPYINTDKPTTEDYKDTNNKHREDEIITIAAHHEGDEYTDEDKKLIEDFKQLVLSRKKSK